MDYFTRSLSYFYGLYQFVIKTKKRNFVTESILSELEDLLKDHCSREYMYGSLIEVKLHDERISRGGKKISDIDDIDGFESRKESLGQKQVSLRKRRDDILCLSVFGG